MFPECHGFVAMPIASCIKDIHVQNCPYLISEGRNDSTLWPVQQRNHRDSQETCYQIWACNSKMDGQRFGDELTEVRWLVNRNWASPAWSGSSGSVGLDWDNLYNIRTSQPRKRRALQLVLIYFHCSITFLTVNILSNNNNNYLSYDNIIIFIMQQQHAAIILFIL